MFHANESACQQVLCSCTDADEIDFDGFLRLLRVSRSGSFARCLMPFLQAYQGPLLECCCRVEVHALMRGRCHFCCSLIALHP